VDLAGGMLPVMASLKKYKAEHKESCVRIEIEVRNFTELNEVLKLGEGLVDRIMLDNFTVVDLARAVEIIGGRFETEASGGIRLSNIRKYAETGVTYVSVGALTHNFKSLDMNLKVVAETGNPEDS
jgi:nicotinate-nucleotide pyrophosphorylase (carboxylating)